MHEEQLLSLIARGETEAVDFKRELHLDGAREKAELIKDIIAIANTVLESGYLLIGVNDSGEPVEIKGLPEERIQQIAHTYITPPVILKCEIVPLASHDFTSVGLIQIKPTKKPHKVARNIGRVEQDTVYVRRGTVVSKASPEEIGEMLRVESTLLQEASQYFKAAETHRRLKNYKNAIAGYSKVIDIAPSAEAFFGRAMAYLKDPDRDFDSGINPAKDFSDALLLSQSEKFTKEIREERFHRLAYYYRRGGSDYSLEELHKDFESTANELEGSERVEWMLFQISEIKIPWDSYTIRTLQEIIESNEDVAYAYKLLTEVHIEHYNYGLALELADKAIQEFRYDIEQKFVYRQLLHERVQALIAMKRYREAKDTILKIRQQFQEVSYGHFGDLATDELLLRRVLAYDPKGYSSAVNMHLIRFLAYCEGSQGDTDYSNNQTVSRLSKLEDSCPGILETIREIIGEEDWFAIHSDTEKSLSFRFPPLN
jgi:hypothetical protein